MMPFAFAILALLAALAAAPTSGAAAFIVPIGPSNAGRRAVGDVTRLPPLMMNKRASKRRPAKKSGGGFGKKPRVTSMNIKKRAKPDFAYAG